MSNKLKLKGTAESIRENQSADIIINNFNRSEKILS